MQRWRGSVARELGFANICLGVIGLGAVALAAFRVASGTLRYPGAIYFLLFFPGMAVIAAGWFLLCLWSGIYLWHLRRRGYLLAIFLYLFWALFHFSPTIVCAFFEGERSIQVQSSMVLFFVQVWGVFVLLYALLGLCILGLLVRKSELAAE